MSVLWALIGLSMVGAWLCVRSRAALPGAFFSVLAVVLFLYTAPGQSVVDLVTNLHISAGAAGVSR